MDPIERNAVRAVVIVLGLLVLIAGGLAFWSRYRLYAEQKDAQQRREYEQEMAQLMDQGLLAEGMTRGMVRATIGSPDSVAGTGEIVETWYYDSTNNYGPISLRFEHDQLKGIQKKDLQTE